MPINAYQSCVSYLFTAILEDKWIDALMPKVWLHSHGGYIPICYKERRHHQFSKNAMLFEQFLVVTDS